MRRRGRGQHRKPGHHHHTGRNQTFDSNGPGVRLRGTAHQIYEKYLTVGRDAAASGDRIMAENYFQHADHYYRIILASQGPLEQFQERNDGADPDGDADTRGYGQSDQPMPGDGQQPPAAGTVPLAQSFNGSGQSQGTSLPGSNPARGDGPREGRSGDGRDAKGGEGEGAHSGQQQNYRRDRYNRRFRNREDRGSYQDQGGERREGREQREERPNRDRDQRQQRREDEAFEPPAFLKAERPASEIAPRDPFKRDDEE